MKLPLSLIIGLRYSRSAKDGKFISFISFFSMAGIALGVMSLIIVLSVMDGFEGELKKRILGAVPHLTLAESRADSPQISIIKAQSMLEQIDSAQYVEQFLPLIESQAIVQLNGDLKGMLIQGIQDQTSIPNGVKNSLNIGSWSDFFANKYSVVIGRYVAMEYGLSVGDKVRLMISGTSHYTPIGRMPAQRTFEVTGLFSTESEIDGHLMFVRAPDLNRLMKLSSDSTSGLRLVLDDAFRAQSIQEKLQQQAANNSLKINSWHQTHGKLFDAVKMEKNMMWFMLSLIIAVAAFNIVSALVMMVTKKQSEVAILKTLGMSPYGIRFIFLVQGGYNGMFGALIGGVLGIILVLFLNDLMAITGISLLGVPGVGLPMDFNVIKAVLIVLFAIVLALLASIYPAKKASQLLPADVLRHE